MDDAAQVASSEAHQRAPISFGLQANKAATAEEQSLLDAERERQKKRPVIIFDLIQPCVI